MPAKHLGEYTLITWFNSSSSGSRSRQHLWYLFHPSSTVIGRLGKKATATSEAFYPYLNIFQLSFGHTKKKTSVRRSAQNTLLPFVESWKYKILPLQIIQNICWPQEENKALT